MTFAEAMRQLQEGVGWFAAGFLTAIVSAPFVRSWWTDGGR